MQNFQDTFETRKRSFISAFSICMTVPLMTVIYIYFRRTEVFCKKGVLKDFTKLTEPHLHRGASFLIKLQATPATLLKKRLRHRCFPVKFVKKNLEQLLYRIPSVATSAILKNKAVTEDLCILASAKSRSKDIKYISAKLVFLKMHSHVPDNFWLLKTL